MDSIPIEYSERMMAEQMAMMEALQSIAQFLIYFALLVAFVILIVKLAGALRQNAWQDGVDKKRVARRRSQVVRRRSAKPLYAGSIPAAASRSHTGSENEFDAEPPQTLSGKKKETRRSTPSSSPSLCGSVVDAESLL